MPDLVWLLWVFAAYGLGFWLGYKTGLERYNDYGPPTEED